jgi:phospholipase C
LFRFRYAAEKSIPWALIFLFVSRALAEDCWMDSRRDFIKKALLLAAGGGLTGVLPASIQRAFAIDPPTGSTYLDAEHVVILMQENRSFDHAYGALRGVRGFNDPRAVTLPDGNPVWLQTNEAGETYAPFRLNIKETKATWMGSLPHGWPDQGEARNNGKHDRWLLAKKLKDFPQVPMTLGYYNRQDIPFYYALADAFTICDQNFCSSLTPTTPNRLHLWTGTVRAKPSMREWAHVNNEDTDYDAEVHWTTFPERLEERGISWRIYQNEISLPSGLSDEADSWLTNFGDNPLEWFTQYGVRFSASYRSYLVKKEKSLEAELDALQRAASPDSDALQKPTGGKRDDLGKTRSDLAAWTPDIFAKLPAHEQNLHLKAFTSNAGDPDYRELAALTYHDGATEGRMQAPKGDVFHQFRQDAQTGKLPTVSWIVAPEKFSDHPSSPWFGAWYVSEALDILTQNPEVWKKTIFILCYDENDGYFDHVPPFVPPHPDRPETGKVSAGMDTSPEYVSREQEEEIRRKDPTWTGQAGPIGLGFRVPLVVASPWSRGGYACSQVFDHTSMLKFLEVFLSHKTGRPIVEPNISQWRRTVCGDLTSVFRPYIGEKIALPTPVERDAFLGSIQEARNRPVPDNFKKLSAEEIMGARENQASPALWPQQERGVRPSCALPYELAADGALSNDRKSFLIHFAADKGLFGDRAAGAPFHAYGPCKTGWARSYAVRAGDRISDEWLLTDFEEGIYHLRVQGPNGFHREFRGTADDPMLEVQLRGNAELGLANRDPQRPLTVTVADLAYGGDPRTVNLKSFAGTDARVSLALDLAPSFGWHDLRIRVEGFPNFEQRLAGRMENGDDSFTDPFMGRA